MAARRTLTLGAEERAELTFARDHDPRPYLRERAAALLKIADGQSPRLVARTGLLKPRAADTVYIWLNEYQQTRKLRPRPPCRGPFSPSGRRARADAEPTT